MDKTDKKKPNLERYYKLKVAQEIIEDIHKEMCHDDNITRDEVLELHYIYIELLKFREKLGKNI